MFYEGINAKVFRHSIASAIAVVVTSRSSSLEYTISVHAVHAGTEISMCNSVACTETPQTTSNSSQTLLSVYKLACLPLPHTKPPPPRPHNLQLSLFTQMRYRCKHKVSSAGLNILEVYIIYFQFTCFIYIFVLMNSFIQFDEINLGWFIVYGGVTGYNFQIIFCFLLRRLS